AGAEPLRDAYQAVIRPFLASDRRATNCLSERVAADEWFADLKDRLDPAAHGIVDELERACERRRQFDRQAAVHGWLHSWLWVHLPLSAVLIALLVWHAVTAVIYW